MAEVYKKTLIHEWNFLGEERTEDERLTDTVGGVKVKLGYNASLQPEGIYLSYGDANYMKAYALMENVVGRGCLLEVDVASFKGNWDSNQHGRFIMMDDSSTSFDEAWSSMPQNSYGASMTVPMAGMKALKDLIKMLSPAKRSALK